jgi:hypothetical protein
MPLDSHEGGYETMNLWCSPSIFRETFLERTCRGKMCQEEMLSHCKDKNKEESSRDMRLGTVERVDQFLWEEDLSRLLSVRQNQEKTHTDGSRSATAISILPNSF